MMGMRNGPMKVTNISEKAIGVTVKRLKQVTRTIVEEAEEHSVHRDFHPQACSSCVITSNGNPVVD